MNDYPTGTHAPEEIQVEKEFRRCPACDYDDGFHVSFASLEGRRAEVILICPRCSRRYRTGWATSLV